MPDALADFTKRPFTHAGATRDVYRVGSGPAVVVLAEMPGITPGVATFARRVAATGCTAVLPHLFGVPGADPSGRRLVRSFAPACVSREFAAFAGGVTAPVTDWLRALARDAHAECGGRGVGAVGMCFTGGFALGMLLEPAVLASVLSQPSLPLPVPWRKGNRADAHLAPADVAAVRDRITSGACAVGLRFTGDRFVPAERFATLRRELGDGFVAVEIDSSPGNPHGIDSKAHSVLTEHLVDEPGHPTRDALDRVLELFRRLH